MHASTMHDFSSSLTRRHWLGIAAGAIPSLTLPPRSPAAASPPPSEPFVSIRDFGAVGDGRADDTRPLVTALNAARTAAATLYLPPGTYRCTDLVQTSTPCRISGAGPASAIVFDPAIPFKAPYISFLIRGAAHAAPGDDWCSLTDFSLVGQSNGPEGRLTGILAGLGLENVSGIVDSVAIRRAWGMALVYHACHDLTISRCRIEESGRDGITGFWNNKRIWIVDNFIDTPGDDGIAFNAADSAQDLTAEDICISGNHIANGRFFGRGIYLAGVQRVMVAYNSIDGVVSTGIAIQPSLKLHTRSTDVSLIGNRVTAAGSRPELKQPLAGIRADSCDRFHAASNLIERPGAQGLFALDCTDVTAISNAFRAWGQSAAASAIDIRSSTHVVLTGNSADGGPGPAVLVENPKGLRLLQNQLEVRTGAAAEFRGATHDCLVSANLFLTDDSALAQAVATSDWTGDPIEFVGNNLRSSHAPGGSQGWPQGVHPLGNNLISRTE